MSNNNNRFILNNNVLEVLNIVIKHDFVHIREISRLAKISPTTAGSILKGLEENNILAKKVLGKNCFYSLNKNNKAKKLIAMAENYRFLKECSDKNFHSLAENLLKGIAEIKNLVDSVILYKEKDKFSLLFITSLDYETIKSRISKLDSTVEKITVLTKENFRNNLESEMIKNIIKDYIVIFGTENFVDLIY